MPCWSRARLPAHGRPDGPDAHPVARVCRANVCDSFTQMRILRNWQLVLYMNDNLMKYLHLILYRYLFGTPRGRDAKGHFKVMQWVPMVLCS